MMPSGARNVVRDWLIMSVVPAVSVCVRRAW
ncbi:hypothetical protein C9F11_21105 [Streptomyces sp. YIM 121038]|nr:hypothetical protein C9F11_21105 [Streptomyces sp. YIM 121038]